MKPFVCLAGGISTFGITNYIKEFAEILSIDSYAFNQSIFNDLKGRMISADKLVIIDHHEPWNSKDHYEEIIEKRNLDKKITKIIFDRSFEGGSSVHSIKSKLKYYSSLGIKEKDVLFFLNRSCNLTDNEFNTFRVDEFAVSSFINCFQNGHPVSSLQVEHRPNKINLLMGKISKHPRPIILDSFHRHNLFKNTLTGLLTTLEDLERFNNNPKLKLYLKKNAGPADNVFQQRLEDSTVSSTGWSGNCYVYNNTSLSYVVETWMDDTMFLTEKTYRAIVNRHPFVLAGPVKSLEYLHSLGFKTFHEFIDESYDSIMDWGDNGIAEKIEKTVVESERFLKVIPKNYKKIEEIVDFNLERFKEYAFQEYSVAKKRIADFLNVA